MQRATASQMARARQVESVRREFSEAQAEAITVLPPPPRVPSFAVPTLIPPARLREAA
jgi:hypothetical protein